MNQAISIVFSNARLLSSLSLLEISDMLYW